MEIVNPQDHEAILGRMHQHSSNMKEEVGTERDDDSTTIPLLSSSPLSSLTATTKDENSVMVSMMMPSPLRQSQNGTSYRARSDSASPSPSPNTRSDRLFFGRRSNPDNSSGALVDHHLNHQVLETSKSLFHGQLHDDDTTHSSNPVESSCTAVEKSQDVSCTSEMAMESFYQATFAERTAHEMDQVVQYWQMQPRSPSSSSSSKVSPIRMKKVMPKNTLLPEDTPHSKQTLSTDIVNANAEGRSIDNVLSSPSISSPGTRSSAKCVQFSFFKEEPYSHNHCDIDSTSTSGDSNSFIKFDYDSTSSSSDSDSSSTASNDVQSCTELAAMLTDVSERSLSHHLLGDLSHSHYDEDELELELEHEHSREHLQSQALVSSKTASDCIAGLSDLSEIMNDFSDRSSKLMSNAANMEIGTMSKNINCFSNRSSRLMLDWSERARSQAQIISEFSERSCQLLNDLSELSCSYRMMKDFSERSALSQRASDRSLSHRRRQRNPQPMLMEDASERSKRLSKRNLLDFHSEATRQCEQVNQVVHNTINMANQLAEIEELPIVQCSDSSDGHSHSICGESNRSGFRNNPIRLLNIKSVANDQYSDPEPEKTSIISACFRMLTNVLYSLSSGQAMENSSTTHDTADDDCCSELSDSIVHDMPQEQNFAHAHQRYNNTTNATDDALSNDLVYHLSLLAVALLAVYIAQPKLGFEIFGFEIELSIAFLYENFSRIVLFVSASLLSIFLLRN